MQCQGQRGVLEIQFANTGHVHVPRAPVGVRRARLDGLLRGRRLGGGQPGDALAGRLGWRLWALVPVLLLALAVGVVVTSGSSLADLVGHEPAARGRVRHPAGRVLAGRDPDPRPQPAAGRPDDRERQRRRRDRPVHGRRPDDARPAALEHDRRPVRLGRGRPDHGRRDELDGDRDRRGDPGRDRDAAAVGRRLLRLRAHRAARRASSRSRSGCSGCPRCGRRARPGSRRSWRSRPGCSRSSASRRSSEAFELQAALAGRARRRRARAARGRAELPRDDRARRRGSTQRLGRDAGSRSRSSSRSASASTTSARGSRSARRSRSASSSSGRS